MRPLVPSLFLAAVLALLTAAPAPAGAFVSGTEDVPLMAGLVEEAGRAVAFDTPQGRLVEVEAAGTVSAEAVAAFYRETLPQLGWSEAGGGYVREGEYLHIEFGERDDGRLSVRFSLSPVPR